MSVHLIQSTYISTSKEQVEILQHQLGHDLPLIVEPKRRDTFPAIALACAYLFSVEKADLNEVICVLPADPYVEESFFHKVKQLEKIIRDSKAELVLIGVQPTYPAESYGYIVPSWKTTLSNHTNGYITVNQFIEKPKADLAETLIQQQALWNCGVFAFSLGFLISILIERGLPTNFKELEERYDQLPSRSFDYEVVERAKNIVVTPYNGFWKDLGTWDMLTDEMETNIIGKGIISQDSSNTHLINELFIPVVIQGLSNVVVASSPDGVLITKKSVSNMTKELTQGIKQRPMYEEKRWGWYRVLEYIQLEEGKEVLTKRLRVFQGKNISYQMHQKRSEVWTIITGEGKFVLDDRMYHVKQGDVLQIPAGAKHGIAAITDLEFIEVQMGSKLMEEDIVRISMLWQEVEKMVKGVNGDEIA